MEFLHQTQLLFPMCNLLKALICVVSECSTPLCVRKMQLAFLALPSDRLIWIQSQPLPWL